MAAPFTIDAYDRNSWPSKMEELRLAYSERYYAAHGLYRRFVWNDADEDEANHLYQWQSGDGTEADRLDVVNLHSAPFWRGMQLFFNSKSRFADPEINYDGVLVADFPFASLEGWYEYVGGSLYVGGSEYGFRRKYPDPETGEVVEGRGIHQEGDYIGYWLVEDLIRMMSRVTKVAGSAHILKANNATHYWRAGITYGEWGDWQDTTTDWPPVDYAALFSSMYPAAKADMDSQPGDPGSGNNDIWGDFMARADTGFDVESRWIGGQDYEKRRRPAVTADGKIDVLTLEVDSMDEGADERFVSWEAIAVTALEPDTLLGSASHIPSNFEDSFGVGDTTHVKRYQVIGGKAGSDPVGPSELEDLLPVYSGDATYPDPDNPYADQYAEFQVRLDDRSLILWSFTNANEYE